MAFKPNTDDVREAPGVGLVRDLVQAGATVRAHDPKATHEAQKALGQLPRLTWHGEMYDATQGADVLCLMTEWRPFRRPDFRKLAAQLAGRAIFDGRNQYDDVRCREFGLDIFPVGVPTALDRR